ncbi:hypothetical protein LCGC14_1914970 [marine sediment metagenome]|uniref:Uncharacterized protein n=1 Tax=marine sediment metagenome TaxID=412755 RepID=A0A0F9I6I6_9ZZZZ
MQITVKTSKCLKKGTNDYGPWALFKIVATDEKVYTTLSEGAEVLAPGAIFEPVDVILGEIKAGVQEYKFKKFTLVTAGSEPPPPGPNGSGSYPEMSKEEWAEKQRIERSSFETQTAYKGILDLAGTEQFQSLRRSGDELKIRLDTTLDEALDWAVAHFRDTGIKVTIADLPLALQVKNQQPAGGFKNVGEFLTAMKDKGLSRQGVIDELLRLKMITGEADLPKLDLEVAWEALGDAIIPDNIPF